MGFYGIDLGSHRKIEGRQRLWLAHTGAAIWTIGLAFRCCESARIFGTLRAQPEVPPLR